MKRRLFLFGMAGAAMMRSPQSQASTAHIKPVVSPSQITISDRDLDILTRTLWGEVRGESEEGKIAVAHVIFNRVRSQNPEFKPDTSVAKVCMQHNQFSCWANKHAMWRISKTSDEYKKLKETAIRALWTYRDGHDYSNHATYYLKRASGWPKWTRKMRLTKRIDHHAFFKMMVG